ncbi:hypothetical protein D6D29_01161 [Aureobasidium pullulans]|nr:hypothetical protein D6D29_01161 [Aureobasidium pullulans]
MSTGSRKKKSKLGAARSSTRTNTTGTADAGQLQTKDQDQTQAQIQAPSSSKVSPETSGGAPIAEINNAIKVNDHKSPSATPKMALLLPQKPPVPQKLLRQSQKRKYQQNLEFPQKQEAQQRLQIRQLPPILQPHAAGVKGPTDASNSPSFINPAKVIKPDNAQQERCSRFSEEQHRTLELRSERILEKLKLKTLTELITLQMNNQEEYVSNLIGNVIFEKRMNALNTLESQL